MKQLTQNLKTGKMQQLEVPLPATSPKQLLVRVHYSAISPGTEGSKVSNARKGYIGKAKAKPEQVKQVFETLKREGPLNTYRRVMNKLDAPEPIGYSCAGEVIAVGEAITRFKVGDRVACGGQGAHHAEVVSVWENLCVKVPDGVDLRHAALTTVASIAIQGVRRADVQLGESCLVIGLGLIGQLTMQLLSAAGVQPIGVDIDPAMVAIARELGFEHSFERNDAALEGRIESITLGLGVDSVIITAGAKSTDPVELAGRACRHKGKVVIVGAVPTGFSRQNYYQKELELRMSTSYGPGRYDPTYEEKGVDYPPGYVRWTENRNMQSFLSLLAAKKINVNPLIRHCFDFKEAAAAYDLILKRSEPFLGILLKYDPQTPVQDLVQLDHHAGAAPSGDVRVGFVGAGSFAQNFLLPNCAKIARMIGVATSTGVSARKAADKYHFQYATGDAQKVLNDPEISTIFIATRHHLHAPFVMDALRADKHVFVEKPLCLTEEELAEIADLYSQQNVQLMVGFNRRFAPLVKTMQEYLGGAAPASILYRINTGAIPANHWTQDPEIGGGRILGEVCHFVDLCQFLAGSAPEEIHAVAQPTPNHPPDTLSVNLRFQNGSIATIAYFANGSKNLPKEYLEVYRAGKTAVLDDFSRLTLYGASQKSIKATQDKGHKIEIERFLESIRKGLPSPIPFDEIYLSTLATLKIHESLRNGAAVKLPRISAHESE